MDPITNRGRLLQLARILRERTARSNQLHAAAIQTFVDRHNSRDPLAVPDSEFKRNYRLTKPCFKYLCQLLARYTSLRPSQRTSLRDKVLMVLYFYAQGSYQSVVGNPFVYSQQSISKFVGEVTSALNEPGIRDLLIKFPATRQARQTVAQKFYTKYGIPGVIGCVDGCHFHIFKPKYDIEHLYYCRKHFHSINVQMVCDSECRILNVNARYGGSTHDAFIWSQSMLSTKLEELYLNNEHVWLLGDSGYPQRPWLMTPIVDAEEGSPEARYTSLHSKARVTIENTFGRLKNRWRCLCKDRTLHYSPEKSAKIIVACAVLHNLALDYGIGYPTELHNEEEVELRVNLNLAEIVDGDDLSRGRAVRSALVQRLSSAQ